MSSVLKDPRHSSRRWPEVRAPGSATEWKYAGEWGHLAGTTDEALQGQTEMWGHTPTEDPRCFVASDRVRVSLFVSNATSTTFPLSVRVRVRSRDLLAVHELIDANFILTDAGPHFLTEVRGFETIDKFEIILSAAVVGETFKGALVGFVDKCCLEPAIVVGETFGAFNNPPATEDVTTPIASVAVVPGLPAAPLFVAMGTNPTLAENQTRIELSPALVGDNIIIPGAPAQIIRVTRLYLVVSAPTVLRFKSGAATNFTGQLTMVAGGAITLDMNGNPWFVTIATDGFVLSSTVAVTIGGQIFYTF